MSPEEWKRLAKESVTNDDLATAVLKYRKENSLSQKDFPDMVGISRNLVSRIENSGPEDMRYQTYQSIVSTVF